jgi:chorismate dehydratase
MRNAECGIWRAGMVVMGVGDGSGVRHTVGCVSFLNSKPLIDPLVGREDVEIRFAVPSALLGLVEAGVVSTALMSVVDYQESKRELFLVPAGMIGCDGPTLTVRIYSKVPPEKISVVHGDTDSHTSVVLAQVIMAERYGRAVRMVSLVNAECGMRNAEGDGPETMLLIGDKVVNAAPDSLVYRHQLDLGEEWKALTGLPFVFAMWMMRRDMVDRELARMLAEARRVGAGMTEGLLDRYCLEKGWPRELARRYFTEYLRYEVTGRARKGLAKFFELAGKLGVMKIGRKVEYLEVD